MEIVIKIDDEMVCNDITNKALEPTTATDKVIINALYNGILLPKGHGRLIDADKLDTRERGNNSQRTMWWEIDRIVKHAPTIVEADKG